MKKQAALNGLPGTCLFQQLYLKAGGAEIHKFPENTHLH